MSRSPEELEQYLHTHIPLSRDMAVSVVSADHEAVILTAPLAPNKNHRNTVFGGSASALAMLACWSLLRTRLMGEGIDSRLVIQRNTMDFERPIVGDFTARAILAAPEQWDSFTRMLTRKGKARVIAQAVLEQGGEVVGRFRGEFVALPASGE